METRQQKRQRAAKIYETLDPLYTKEKTALDFHSPFELLVATILSAQCTDKQVNKVTPYLFKKYKHPQDYIDVPIAELEEDIRPTGFFRNKAKALKGCSEGLVRLYNGQVPQSMEKMLKLPGVGRKTANCVLGAAFGVPGVVVDTHVKRLSRLLGLADSRDADKIEAELAALLPADRWRRFSDLMIYHGRAVCKARHPDHARCAILRYCPSNNI